MTAPTLARECSQVLQRDLCPDCDGKGEYQIGQPTRDPYTGTWDVETRICNTCDGTGLIPDGMLICSVDGEPHAFYADEQQCKHGETLCPDHIFDCRVCAAESVL